MKYYLVDYENIRIEGVNVLSDVKEKDAIILFYSEHSKNISLDVINSILQSKLKYSSYKAKVGTKNALDFQLASYLGYLIGRRKSINSKYYIVSNDKGYDCLCEYWKDFGKDVQRISIKGENAEPKQADENKAPKAQTQKKVKESDIATINEIKKYLTNDDKPQEVLKVFNQYKTKVAINNGIVKVFKDGKRASTIYKKIKPLLKEKNKS